VSLLRRFQAVDVSRVVADHEHAVGDGGAGEDRAAGFELPEQIANKAMAYASPAVGGNVVVIGARDRQVHAIDLATGKPLWTFKARLDVDSSPLISGGRVYVGSKDKTLYVLDLKRGDLLWEFKATRAIIASPAIADGVLVISDDAGNVYCLEAAKE